LGQGPGEGLSPVLNDSSFGFASRRELPYEIATDDHELLRAFARDRSQEAFRQLVDQHLRLVYAAAHRIVRDPHLAEEVAQNAFTLLAMHCVRSKKHRRERFRIGSPIATDR
jgi:hypothetical protein